MKYDRKTEYQIASVSLMIAMKSWLIASQLQFIEMLLPVLVPLLHDEPQERIFLQMSQSVLASCHWRLFVILWHGCG